MLRRWESGWDSSGGEGKGYGKFDLAVFKALIFE